VLQEVDSNLSYREENPFILQALVNELMELYHSMTLAEQETFYLIFNIIIDVYNTFVPEKCK